MSRRSALGLLASGAFLSVAHRAAAGLPRRIVSLDYGLASTLLSLGVVPAAISALADWDKWVVEPPMPPGVVDLGSTWEVNFEILVALKPDLILTTPYVAFLESRLEKIAPVLRLEIYSPEGGDVLPKAIDATRRLGQAIGMEAEAEAFLARADGMFEDYRRRNEAVGSPPVALLNFVDARHVRVNGPPGLFDSVLHRIGLTNAWDSETNYWGFQTIGIEQLAIIEDSDVRLFAFEPLPPDALPTLSKSPLWTALPFTGSDQFAVIPSIFAYGMVNDGLRFARLITDRLHGKT